MGNNDGPIKKAGFTLAELLIVVAIVSVLVAISIPIFSGKKEKAEDATTKANIRTSISMAYADYLEKGRTDTAYYLYNLYQEKLYDAVEDKFSNSPDPLPVRSQKRNYYAGIFVVINANDLKAPIKTYPYINEDGEVVFEKEGVKDWDAVGGKCDAISPKAAYESAGLNHFSN